MYLSEKDLVSSRNIINFTLPQLHRGKQVYVDFYAFDPVSGKLRRKKYMLNRYKKKADRSTMAALIIHNIIEKLKAGWNPFVNANRTRQFTPFPTILSRYKDFLRISEKKNIFKHKTVIDYQSRIAVIEKYFKETDAEIKYAYQFNRAFCIDFLDYLLFDKDVTTRTRNNYRTWLSTFASWLVDKQYIDENPVEKIKMMREDEKFRKPLSKDALSRLRAYLYINNRPFLLACLLEYYAFIRPNELRFVKIGYFSIENQTVTIPGEFSKNRKRQTVALHDSVLKLMIELHVFDRPSQEYLFGPKLVPSAEQIPVNRFRLEWVKVRNALHFPVTYQFYSLKDAGIEDVTNCLGLVNAQRQARHANAETTNRYIDSVDIINEGTKHFNGNF